MSETAQAALDLMMREVDAMHRRLTANKPL
jgi:hypothetical protein